MKSSDIRFLKQIIIILIKLVVFVPPARKLHTLNHQKAVVADNSRRHWVKISVKQANVAPIHVSFIHNSAKKYHRVASPLLPLLFLRLDLLVAIFSFLRLFFLLFVYDKPILLVFILSFLCNITIAFEQPPSEPSRHQFSIVTRNPRKSSTNSFSANSCSPLQSTS